jgi:hypothetical protein
MNRYMIEVSHEPTHQDCLRLAGSMTQAGAHYIEAADWGCEAGVHSGWMIVEALNDDDARLIVPPSLRCQARVVRLNKISLGDLQAMRTPRESREPEPVVA